MALRKSAEASGEQFFTHYKRLRIQSRMPFLKFVNAVAPETVDFATGSSRISCNINIQFKQSTLVSDNTKAVAADRLQVSAEAALERQMNSGITVCRQQQSVKRLVMCALKLN